MKPAPLTGVTGQDGVYLSNLRLSKGSWCTESSEGRPCPTPTGRTTCKKACIPPSDGSSCTLNTPTNGADATPIVQETKHDKICDLTAINYVVMSFEQTNFVLTASARHCTANICYLSSRNNGSFQVLFRYGSRARSKANIKWRFPEERSAASRPPNKCGSERGASRFNTSDIDRALQRNGNDSDQCSGNNHIRVTAEAQPCTDINIHESNQKN